jgi:hypothetical protein
MRRFPDMLWFKKTAAPTDDPLPGLKMPEPEKSDWAPQTTLAQFQQGLGTEGGQAAYDKWSKLVDMKVKAEQEMPQWQRERGAPSKIAEAFTDLTNHLTKIEGMQTGSAQAQGEWAKFAEKLNLNYQLAVQEAQEGPETQDPWADVGEDEPQVTQRDPLAELSFSEEEQEEFRKQWSSHGKNTKLAGSAAINLKPLPMLDPEGFISKALAESEKTIEDRMNDAAKNPRRVSQMISRMKDSLIGIAAAINKALSGPAVTQQDPAAPATAPAAPRGGRMPFEASSDHWVKTAAEGGDAAKLKQIELALKVAVGQGDIEMANQALKLLQELTSEGEGFSQHESLRAPEPEFETACGTMARNDAHWVKVADSTKCSHCGEMVDVGEMEDESPALCETCRNRQEMEATTY